MALGGRQVAVLVLGGCLTSAWLMRFEFASQMYATQSVQLYPRTTPEILYCLLLLAGFAVYFASQRYGRPPGASGAEVEEIAQNRSRPSSFLSGLPKGASTIGALCAVVLFSLFAGAATADRYMPRDDNSLATLTYFSQLVRQQDGTCPAYSAPNDCVSSAAELHQRLKNSRQPTGPDPSRP